MWIKINNEKEPFDRPEKILDYNAALNITSRDVNTARQTLTLYAEGHKIVCKPLKGHYQEWLTMLRYSREAIATTPAGY